VARLRPSPAGCHPIRRFPIRLLASIVAAALLSAGLASSSSPSTPRTVRALWVHDAICETGRNPPNWRFHVGVYQGGIAFYYTTWDAWKIHVPEARRYAEADQAPAWAQAAVAEWGLRHLGRWGCLFHADVWKYR
jgi:hypothetical protein